MMSPCLAFFAEKVVSSFGFHRETSCRRGKNGTRECFLAEDPAGTIVALTRLTLGRSEIDPGTPRCLA